MADLLLVSVVTPTRHRPAPLRRALASLDAQILPEGVALEIVVVDNSLEGDAARELTRASTHVRALHAPRPGVAEARNAGVAAARGEWIAFLDDDEEAAPGWIAALVATARVSGADAVFGPVVARAEENAAMGPFAPYFSRRLAVADGAEIANHSAYLGTNNSMFRARCLNGGQTFDVALNESGGEDSLLIERLRRAGRRFVYSEQAEVVEWAPPRRLNWAYVERRKFLSGQIRVFVQHMAAPRRLDVVLIWMAAGALQFLSAGAAALALTPFASARARRLRAAAWGGLGKLLWQRSFRPALYGAGHVS